METFLAYLGSVCRQSLNSSLRTIDVARRTGYSVQQIRNLERDGAIGQAQRTASGYRVYREEHVRAALAYRWLAAGVGPVRAKDLLRVAHRSTPVELAARLDTAHAELAAERRLLARAERAVETIAGERIDDTRPTDAMTVSELAGALGIPASTLRHWDAEGLVVPGRSASGRARSYQPEDVRDARIVHQLRQAGYRIGAVRDLLPQLRGADRLEEVAAALATRDQSIASRSLALLRAAGYLADVLRSEGGTGGQPERGAWSSGSAQV